jgi:hypothetical protein
MNNSKQTFLIFAAGAGAGLIAGYFAARAGEGDLRGRFSNALSELQHSLRRFVSTGTAGLGRVSAFVEKNFSSPVPDLYKVLDSFDLSDEDPDEK